jgi:hypothetical protein|tara:strand:+ start:1402 stop:1521 length:120 start_codon:yes stop_codon:yes gene_type:complete
MTREKIKQVCSLCWQDGMTNPVTITRKRFAQLFLLKINF